MNIAAARDISDFSIPAILDSITSRLSRSASADAPAASSGAPSMYPPLITSAGNCLLASFSFFATATTSPFTNATALGPLSISSSSAMPASLAARCIRVFLITARLASTSRRLRRSSVISSTVRPRYSVSSSALSPSICSLSSATRSILVALGIAPPRMKNAPPQTAETRMVGALPLELPRQVPAGRDHALVGAPLLSVATRGGYGLDPGVSAAAPWFGVALRRKGVLRSTREDRARPRPCARPADRSSGARPRSGGGDLARAPDRDHRPGGRRPALPAGPLAHLSKGRVRLPASGRPGEPVGLDPELDRRPRLHRDRRAVADLATSRAVQRDRDHTHALAVHPGLGGRMVVHPVREPGEAVPSGTRAVEGEPRARMAERGDVAPDRLVVGDLARRRGHD